MDINAIKILTNKAVITSRFAELIKDDIPHDKPVLIRNEVGEVINSCYRPAVLCFIDYEQDEPIVRRIYGIDEYSKLLPRLLDVKESLHNSKNEIADGIAKALHLIELPRNQLLVDLVATQKEFLGKFIKRCQSITSSVVDILNHPTDLEVK